MAIVAASARLKADMKKVGDTMTKEWLDKAGQEDKAMLEPGLAVACFQRHLHRQRRHAAVAAATAMAAGTLALLLAFADELVLQWRGQRGGARRRSS